MTKNTGKNTRKGAEKMKALLALIVVLCLQAQSLAQQSEQEKKPEPTLPETIKWLEENLPTKAVYSGKQGKFILSVRVISAKLTGCVCELKVEEETSSVGSMTRVNTTSLYNIPFTALDLEKIKTNSKLDQQGFQPPATLLHLFTKDEANLIQYKSSLRIVGRPSESSLFTNSVTLYIGEEEMAKRFARAFAHAIKLCQANKKEPF